MNELFKHQNEAVEFIGSNDGSGAIFHEIGCGKTLTGLSCYKAMKQQNDNLKLLVICPLSLLEAAWGEDIKKFTNFKYWNLHKNKPLKNNRLMNIYLINYESLLSEAKKLYLKNLVSKYNFMCVLDESSRIKNHSAQTTKSLIKMKNMFKHRIILSGTPAPNSESEYWSQMTFVRDRIFHPSFYAFRNHYFHLQRDDQRLDGKIVNKAILQEAFKKGFKYVLSNARRKELVERMKPYCHFAKKKDCLDLPEQINETREITMGPKQKSIYLQMKRHAIIEVKQILEDETNNRAIAATTALTKLMKLRQITSGFGIDEDGNVIDIGTSPKLKELTNIIEDNKNDQIIVWANFRHEIKMIQEKFKEDAVSLYGETKNKDEVIYQFKNNEKRILIAHPASAGHGLTFVNCCIQVFFSLDYSWERYEQSRGRTHRAGQKNPCVYIHIMAKDSIDYDILDILNKKASAVEVVEKWLRQ